MIPKLMKSQFDLKSPFPTRPGSQRAGAKVSVLMAVLFLALAVAGWFYLRNHNQNALIAGQNPTTPRGLSEPTMAILQQLHVPVECRFYAPADVASLPEVTASFVARVEQLLSEYERVAAGNIRLTRREPEADSAARAAAGRDGVLPQADGSGGVFYLGIVVASGGRSETLSPLLPAWEEALESDLSRAIARVSVASATTLVPAVTATPTPAPVDATIAEELVRTIPDLQSRSFDDAAKVLREASLAEFTAAAREMQEQVRLAEQQIAATQGQADQQSAVAQLQQLQSEQTAKLKEITARLQQRITVLERLKGVSGSTRTAR